MREVPVAGHGVTATIPFDTNHSGKNESCPSISSAEKAKACAASAGLRFFITALSAQGFFRQRSRSGLQNRKLTPIRTT